jgi:DNA-binding NarL/FixJ family response regulator
MSRYRIVLADDHTMIRQGIRRLIEGTPGMEVIGEAGDGRELLTLLDTLVPDIIILDMSMPKLRGIDIIEKIKTKFPEVKILALTMHREYLDHALAAGVDGYLLKEDAERELFSAIENIRQGGKFLSPLLTGEFLTRRMRVSDGCRTSATRRLSGREKEILTMVARGMSSREIAEALSISVRTVESHRANIMSKLDLKKATDLVRYAVQNGYA